MDKQVITLRGATKIEIIGYALDRRSRIVPARYTVKRADHTPVVVNHKSKIIK